MTPITILSADIKDETSIVTAGGLLVNSGINLQIGVPSNQRFWPRLLNGTVLTSPVLGDIDHNGNYEVIVGVTEGKSGNEIGKIYVWDNQNQNVTGWPVNIPG